MEHQSGSVSVHLTCSAMHSKLENLATFENEIDKEPPADSYMCNTFLPATRRLNIAAASFWVPDAH